MRRTHLILVASLLTAVACGGKKSKDDSKDNGKSSAKVGDHDKSVGDGPVPKIAANPMGFEKLHHLNYRFGRGSKAYNRAKRAMRKAKNKPETATEQWKTIEKECAAAIVADPRHLGAHFTLAVAKARNGQSTGIAPHLSIALAGDWLQFGPTLTKQAELTKYLQSPEGRGVLALNKTYKDTFNQKAAGGIMLLGRRSKFRTPKKTGKQWSATRAELFSFDLESKRYLRLTHTKESVAAWLVSPSGDEIAYVAYNQVMWPDKPEDPPLLAHVTIGLLNAETLLPEGRRVHIYKKIHGVGLQYRAGDELVVAGLATVTRYKPGAPRFFVVDKGAGKLRKLKTKPTTPHQLVVTYDWVSRSRQAAKHIQAEKQSSTFRLLRTKQTITLPDSEMVANDAFVWSPDGAHLAFRTLTNPCEDKSSSTLYVVEAATGKLKNLLRGPSEFHMKWLDNDQLVYEDPDGNLRVYSAGEHKQKLMLKNRPGLSLSGLAAKRGPLCLDDAAAKGDKATSPATTAKDTNKSGGGADSLPIVKKRMPPEKLDNDEDKR